MHFHQFLVEYRFYELQNQNDSKVRNPNSLLSVYKWQRHK